MVKFDEVPVNAETEPMSGFESPKYRRRYVPAEQKDVRKATTHRHSGYVPGVPASTVHEIFTLLVPRIVLVRVHWYIVDGCESERTGVHAPETRWSTVRNVPSSRRLFCRAASASAGTQWRREEKRERTRTHPGVSTNKLRHDRIPSLVRGRLHDVDEHLPKALPDRGSVKDDAGLQ
jgi:hypothetical protein